MMRDAHKTIGNLIDKQKIAYVSSVDEDGYPITRAMLAPRNRDGIHVMYFTTNTSSRHAQHYRSNPKASAYFCDKRFYRGVVLKGAIEVLTDDASKAMIWADGDETYYPLGVSDPDYCVLKFTAQSGRYYSNFRSEDFDV